MQFRDEFQTLLSGFSKYNSDGNFLRSVILSVYNGSKDYSIQYKNATLNFSNSRVSIFTAGHDHNIDELIELEKSSKCDGFISRFLICSPEPIRLKEQKDFKNPFLFHKLFIAIHLKHLFPLEYEFDMEGFELQYDSCEKLERISEKFQIKN
ncbi:hypothetical protein BpHYR1_000846 [Brachionus plicatilis]|uniref:Uncharacterized protein n=1 Tax=Brachionus plicatilis TaxID=10195 RepID=A0A3M7RBU8_BRAPC|nr:hypothetical protein BpHYR1_000846 [Brachionus plicatilis]